MLIKDPNIIPGKPADRGAQILAKTKEGQFIIIGPKGMRSSEKMWKEMMENFLWCAWCEDIEYDFLEKDMEMDGMNKMIKIKSVKTKYGNYIVGETFLNKWGMWNPSYEVWKKEKVSGKVEWICESSEQIVTEDDGFYKVDEIKFYPRRNKFVAMSEGEEIAFMVATEYTVEVE